MLSTRSQALSTRSAQHTHTRSSHALAPPYTRSAQEHVLLAPARHTPSACARSLSTSKLSIHVRHTLNTAIAQYSLASAKRSAYVASAHAPRAGSAHAGSAHAQHTIKQHTPRAHTRRHTRSAQAPHKLKRSAHARRHTLARTRSASSQQLTMARAQHRLCTPAQHRLT